MGMAHADSPSNTDDVRDALIAAEMALKRLLVRADSA
jgi:hypothetical protein